MRDKHTHRERANSKGDSSAFIHLTNIHWTCTLFQASFFLVLKDIKMNNRKCPCPHLTLMDYSHKNSKIMDAKGINKDNNMVVIKVITVLDELKAIFLFIIQNLTEFHCHYPNCHYHHHYYYCYQQAFSIWASHYAKQLTCTEFK